MTKQKVLDEIRGYNRFYTEVLGLLNKHVLDSQFSLTESRVLYEIATIQDCTANQLEDKLNLELGQLSKTIKRLTDRGLVIKNNSNLDGRSYLLTLSERGQDELEFLEKSANNKVKKLIEHLPDEEQVKLIKSMRHIRNLLLDGIYPITIRKFNSESDIEYIIDKHRDIYGEEYGLGTEFVEYVEKYVRKFHEKYDENSETIWIAETEGKIAGAMAAVRFDENTAQLRWFFIESDVRGRGLGQKLMDTALQFCKEKKYTDTFLWTLDSLETARHLYRKYGFVITETKENTSWANNFNEERWDLKL